MVPLSSDASAVLQFLQLLSAVTEELKCKMVSSHFIIKGVQRREAARKEAAEILLSETKAGFLRELWGK